MQAVGLHVLPLAVRRKATGRNHRIHVVGEVKEACTDCGQPAKLGFLVVDSGVIPVLGQNACKLNLMKSVHTVNATLDEDIFRLLAT